MLYVTANVCEQTVITSLGLEIGLVEYDILALVGFLIFFCVVLFVALRFIVKEQR